MSNGSAGQNGSQPQAGAEGEPGDDRKMMHDSFPGCSAFIDATYRCYHAVKQRPIRLRRNPCESVANKMKWCITSSFCPVEGSEFEACMLQVTGRGGETFEDLSFSEKNIPLPCRRKWEAFDRCLVKRTDAFTSDGASSTTFNESTSYDEAGDSAARSPSSDSSGGKPTDPRHTGGEDRMSARPPLYSPLYDPLLWVEDVFQQRVDQASDLARVAFPQSFDVEKQIPIDGLGITDGAPDIQLDEKDDRMVMTTALPGMNNDEVTAEIRDGKLHVKAEKRSVVRSTSDKSESSSRAGRDESGGGPGGISVSTIERVSITNFYREYPLPPGVDEKDVSATFHDGVLKVEVKLNSGDGGKVGADGREEKR
eukprot:TRINITY_DN937_c0_g7_i1.p1 TRINITY_DN937_c0_g7~~TRINITY_DN937_c0_g7_i1.p1  ORF type:complete len:378 (+),score=82.99 TRINITY_DN937_c0_g7_i1:34-1134(+)